MDRKTALQNFKREVQEVQTRILVKQLHQEFLTDTDRIFRDFLIVFREFIEEVKRCQKEEAFPAIEIVQISMLRKGLRDQKPVFLLEAYTEDWYLSELEITKEWEYDLMKPYLVQFTNVLMEQRRPYMQLIRETDVYHALYELFPVLSIYVKESIRHGLRETNLNELLEGAEYTEKLVFRYGEYFDISEELYFPPSEEGQDKKLRRLRKAEYDEIMEDFRGVKAEAMSLEDRVFCYSNFAESDLEKSSFRKCSLQGADFSNANLRHADFGESFLADTVFTGAVITGGNFKLARGSQTDALAELPGLFGVSFKNADLRGCDFRMSGMRGADFTGANLEGSKFLKRDEAAFTLTPQQREQILWCE